MAHKACCFIQVTRTTHTAKAVRALVWYACCVLPSVQTLKPSGGAFEVDKTCHISKESCLEILLDQSKLAGRAFCSLGLVAVACMLLLVVFLVLLMLLGLTGCA